MSTPVLIFTVMCAAVLIPWALLALVRRGDRRWAYDQAVAEDARNEQFHARDLAWAALMRATEREEAIAAADLILWELES